MSPFVGFVPRPPTRLVFDDPGDGSGQGGSSISGSDVSNSEKRHAAPLPPERSERRSSKSHQDQREILESKVSEFEPWNLGQEPSVPSRKSQQSKASSGGDPRLSNVVNTPPRRQSYTPPDTIMVTDQVKDLSQSSSLTLMMPIHQEPYAIDTDRHRSRVVISPQAATEPEYTLEKKGHTSVIRVSYPGPGGFKILSVFPPVLNSVFFSDVTTSSTPPGSRTPDGAVALSSFQVIPNIKMIIAEKHHLPNT